MLTLPKTIQVQAAEEIAQIEAFRRELKLPKRTGGISGQKALALYSMIRYHKPRTILELGTRNGNSALLFLQAMKANGGGGRLVSVDIRNVNAGDAVPGPGGRPFQYVPAELLARAGIPPEISVEFVHCDSLAYLRQLRLAEEYALILIDSNHDYDLTREEIPAALMRLQKGGYLVLDDYGSPRITGVKEAADELLADGTLVELEQFEGLTLAIAR